jgi:hypothetical protein
MNLDMIQPDARAGGVLICLLILAGLILGITFGSPIIGVLIGTMAGISAALLVWVGDRGKGSG